jgi:LacI family transcriptional regulator
MNREGEVIGSEIVVITRCRRDLPLIVARRQVDGAVRMLSDVDLAKGFARPPVPWVSILFDVPDVDVVATDDFGGAREVGRYLCGKGHQRIAFIGPEIALARQRLAGLRAAASEAGTDVPNDLVRLQPFVASEGPTRALLDTFIGRRTDALPFTALVAYNDFMAAIAMQFLAARGLRIPEDVSVAGFDGLTPLPFRDSRRIASAAIPLTEIGAAAVRLLEWRLGAPNAPCRKVVIETTLVNGDTVGAPRR